MKNGAEVLDLVEAHLSRFISCPPPTKTQSRAFRAIFECKPSKVYARVDLKRKLEPIKPEAGCYFLTSARYIRPLIGRFANCRSALGV